MKRLKNIIFFVVLMIFYQAGWCSTGNLFTISGSGTTAKLDIILCLNGKSPNGLTCQNYTVTRLTLSILTVKAQHTYPAAGIKIKTPGYTPSGCTPFSNGFCLFSVSDTKPAIIRINDTSAVTVLTLTSITPTSGPTIGGTGFTLTGTNFTGTPGVTFDGVAATNVNVVNSTQVSGVTPANAAGAVNVVITTQQETARLNNGYTYQATAVGQPTGGGVIACMQGTNNLIAATANAPARLVWGNRLINVPNAESNTDGAANTVNIVNCLTNGIGGVGCVGGTPINTYAAGYCSTYQVDSQGNTPCLQGNACFNTGWFLPAGGNTTPTGQLDCLYDNRIILQAAGAGMGDQNYWSSTQNVFDTTTAFTQLFLDGQELFTDKGDLLDIRCVKAFTP